ncbi:MAG: outer membrane beta-barrel protein [Gemmatimonadetes bacterium]|nr:outer membrane beta-barrel protein [Gemmatimonadota bacterium]MYG15196.1 outer membrane beta-barrel protein [Gemmatimonadota bacterium]MYH19255.1 outer membrane beta-barrel protein [Gemmatimonadota bacterium]MYK98891.1 outer membrane beta-barrel protein [Gemmatimonadota bacterium]
MGTFMLRRFPAWLAVLMLAAFPAAAQENNDSAVSGLVEISGFVDASYTYSNLDDSNTFGLDQVEVDLSRNLGDIGSLRADLEWVSDGEGGFTLDAEQGYVTLDLGMGRGEGNYPTLTFGKFNAPIGFELLDAPDMYQYSHALVFDMGLPTNLTGAMLSMDLGGGIDVVVHLTNGWDQNVDVNTNKMIGGRLGYSHEELGGIGFSAMRGDEEGLVGNLTVYDFDLTLTPTPGLIIGGEYNNGKTELDQVDVENSWNGFMVMAHYSLNDVMGLTGRYDRFNREISQVAARRSGAQDHPRSLDLTQQALTIAPTFALTDGLGFLMELRRDFSDEAIFYNSESGKSEESMVNFAFEMTYSF